MTISKLGKAMVSLTPGRMKGWASGWACGWTRQEGSCHGHSCGALCSPPVSATPTVSVLCLPLLTAHTWPASPHQLPFKYTWFPTGNEAYWAVLAVHLRTQLVKHINIVHAGATTDKLN